METLTVTLALLAGVFIRLAIPVAGTIGAVYFLRKLDTRWQSEAKQPPVPASKVECWNIKGCTPAQKKDCKAASSPLPCWQVFRHSNGYLRDQCLSCGVFVDAPLPALKIESRRM